MAWEPPSNKLEFADVGNALMTGAHARYYAQKADTEAAEEKRRVDAQPYIEGAMKGDPAAMGKVAAGDAKTALAISTALQHFDANKRADLKAKSEYTANAANAVLQANPNERAQIYQEMRAEGARRGYDMSTMPPEYSPQLDGQLRGHRALAIDINKELDRQTRLQIHNTPGGGSGGELTPIAPAGAPAAPAGFTPGKQSSVGPGLNGGFAPPDVRQATATPHGAPTIAPAPQPAMVAQAPQAPPQEEGVALAAPPDLKEPPRQPQRSGPVFYEDPTPHGYVMAQDRRKPGQPVIDEHGIRYIHPQTKEVVIFKPVAPQPQERTQPPPGYQRTPEGALAPISGGPADPTRPTPDRIPPGYQVAPGGGLAPIPGGPHDSETIKRETEARRTANEKAIPQTVTKGMQENLNSLKQIDRVDALLDTVPKSVGGPGSVAASILPGAGWLQNRMDPEGVNLRALVADIGSMKIHDRSGAAVTASEFPRLRPFIPTIADDPPTIRSKLANFRAEYTAMLADSAIYYGPENGFKAYGPAVEYLQGGNRGEPGKAAAPNPASDLKKKYGLE